MTTPIGGIGSLQSISIPSAKSFSANQETAAHGMDFQQMLLHSLDEAAGLQKASQSGIEQALTGGDVTQVEALTAMKKADLTLRMMLQIRNRVLDAYNEIQQMRM